MSNIRAWLGGLGLGKYADSFEAEEITPELVATLSDDDLKQLGLPLGPRRAIAAAVAGGASLSAPTPSDDDTGLDAERRQITVMFCDMVGSTEMSEQIDPEELRDVMGAYQRLCGATVERYDGHVAQYLGDGIMAYFGWPTAHEDDAERAVRAALDIVEGVATITSSRPIRVRAGIATGPVVVGSTGGGDPSVAQTAVGETPNMAARLQGLAEPGEVIIGTTAHRLVGGVFDYEERGPFAIKGVSEPAKVWRVIGESSAAGRYEASHAVAATPMVGRNNETGLLLDRWEQVLDGDGQVILMSGEPGVGKSRLLGALQESLADQPLVRFRYQCSAYHTNSAFHPFIAQLTRAAGIGRQDAAEQRLDKLEALLGQTAQNVAEVAPLFATLLSIETDGRYPDVDLGPREIWQATTKSLLDQLRGMAETTPLLAIFEDAHWMDPTTREFIEQMIDYVQDLRVMVIITYRPEFEPPWRGRGHVAQMSLGRLNRRRAAEMVANIAGEKPLPVELTDQIVEKTDGIPLFVEELTKTVLESGLLAERRDRYELSGPLPALAIPATLQDSLMARLDRLAPVKDIAQIGAVIGREFSHYLLSRLAPMGEKELEESLARLVESELVLRRGDGADTVYVFKNALVQDVAYGALLKSRRRALHAEIAKLLDADTGGAEPEVVAHHYSEAEMFEPAVRSWLRAGHRAQERSANQEATVHLEKGLALAENMAPGDVRTDLEINLNLVFGTALIATRGLVEQVAAVFARARDLSIQRERVDERFVATWGLWHYNNVRSSFGAATEFAEELLGVAHDQGDTDLLLQAHHASWTSNLYKGDLSLTQEHAELGVQAYDIDRHRNHKFMYGGHDPGVCCRTIGSISLWALGYPDQAQARFHEAVRLADNLAHPMSMGQARTYGNWTPCLSGDVDQVVQNATFTMEIATEHGIAMYLGRARIMLGWAEVQRGDIKEGIGKIEQGLEECARTGSRMGWTFYYSILADAYRQAEKFEAAIVAIRHARDIAEETGELWCFAEVARVEGEILLSADSPNEDAAAKLFADALDAARKTNARSFELRAATSLARLQRRQGRDQEASALLGPIYDWFEEGFSTADLRQADALLTDLREGQSITPAGGR